MDALTFGTNFQLRGFNSKKEPLTQIELKVLLEDFDMNMDEFIDLCIMCGCDYTKSIGGIGAIKAFKFIKDFGNIENILKEIEKDAKDPSKKQKYIIPAEFKYE